MGRTLLANPSPFLYAACVRLADERCGNEHDNSCDKCRHARIRQDFIESSRYCSPICVALLRPLQHRGENVEFFELVPLNGRKQRA
jgi:hypothetical protein